MGLTGPTANLCRQSQCRGSGSGEVLMLNAEMLKTSINFASTLIPPKECERRFPLALALTLLQNSPCTLYSLILEYEGPAVPGTPDSAFVLMRSTCFLLKQVRVVLRGISLTFLSSGPREMFSG